MSDHYILNGKEVEKADLMTWAKWLESNSAARRVAATDVGDFWVSTTFLGLDHSFGDGPPLLFETMIFRRDPTGAINFGDLYCDRCSTYAQAEEMHEKACGYAREKLLT